MKTHQISDIDNGIDALKYDFENVVKPLFYSFIQGATKDDGILRTIKAKIEEINNKK